MLRNKFMKFAPKEHNDKKVKKTLAKHNVPMFEGHEPAKFSQFGEIAKDVAQKNRTNIITPEGGRIAEADKTFSWQQRNIYGGGGPPPPGSANPKNPYAVSQPKGNPYANTQYAGDNPYLQSQNSESQSQSQSRPAPLRRTQTNDSTASTASTAEARKALFGEAPTRLDSLDEEIDELNHTRDDFQGQVTSEDPFKLHEQQRDQINNFNPENELEQDLNQADLDPVDELNALPSQFVREASPDDLAVGANNNAGTYDYQNSKQQLFEDSEDEDVEYVKREIRQTKQESVESTRRALQIASETETSGRNTLGMLGDQGERLGNSAKTVQLGSVQSRVADENADELRRLNRSIFIPNVSNPFNSRRRAQLKEQKLKSQKAYDEMEQQYLAEQQRESAQRVNAGLNQTGDGYMDQTLRIQSRMNRDNPERKMYQFEADSEDEELEDELAQNLEGISDAAKRLKGLSLKINEEVGTQNKRIETMGDRVDDLDYNLHKTTAKMSTIN